MKRKLNSQKGSAILIAFLALLVVAVVSTLIITAASASAGRIADRTKKQQVMIASQSVAEVLAGSYQNFQPVSLTKESGNWEGNDFQVVYGDFLKESAISILNGNVGEKIEISADVSFAAPIPVDLEDIDLTVRIIMNDDEKATEPVSVGEGAQVTVIPDDTREALNVIMIVTAKEDDYSYSTSVLLAADTHGQSPKNGNPRVNLSWYVSEITKGDITK